MNADMEMKEAFELPNETPDSGDVSGDGGGQVVGTREKWQADELRREEVSAAAGTSRDCQ